jgi:hypothetical protein
MESATKENAARLGQGAEDAKAELQKAQAALTAAVNVAGEITSRILDSDGGAGIEDLAAERAVAEARIEAFGARLADRRRVHEAAVAASQAAERALDEERLAEATAALRSAVSALETKLGAVAEEFARDLGVIEERRIATWAISRRVQIARGMSIDNLTLMDAGPLSRPGALAERFGEMVAAATHAQQVTA